MTNASRLRPALLADGVYTVIVGVLLLFPSWASAMFAYPIKDAAVTSGWGTSIIALGLITLVAASDAEKYSGLVWALVAGLLLTTLDLGYFWATGDYTSRNVLAPVLINIALAIWIWSARPKG